ncbi:MAG: PKD domain-containing protein, partial [Fulvivirga sp.]
GFVIDTVSATCNEIMLNFNATQKGLAEYQWTLKINGTTLFSSNTEGDNFDYLINKTTSPLDLEVELITTNFAGCQSPESSQTIQIEQRQEINVDFDVTPNNQTLPDATVFLTNNTNSGPWNYSWDFGDGNTSSDPNISEYTYTDAGTYVISLTAFTGTCQEVTVKSITINPIPPNPPIVDFDYNPDSGCAPLTVQFTNLSQFTDDASYQWNFGAGQGTSTSINPTYTYFEPGVYTVSLTASNSVGQTDTETKTQIIEVFETPIAQFDVRPTIVFVPDNPIYTNNNSQRATSFFWDFGDGGTSTESEPTYYYKEEGTYDITLIASNSNGCADTLRRESIVEGQMNGRFLVPNAFTPNLSGPVSGDASGQPGTNDIFLPLTQSVKEFEMFIFNRWGEMLFRSKDKNISWDGYYNNKLCPQDVYIYKVNLVFENGQKITRNGDVNLIR